MHKPQGWPFQPGLTESGWEQREGQDDQSQTENVRRQGPWGPAWGMVFLFLS